MTRSQADLLGAVVALAIYVACILVFLLRMWGRPAWAHGMGGVWLLLAVPLAYLLVKAGPWDRPPLYRIQVGLMLVFIVAVLLLDYVWKVDFRQTKWAVITFVTFFFAATGAFLGCGRG